MIEARCKPEVTSGGGGASGDELQLQRLRREPSNKMTVDEK